MDLIITSIRAAVKLPEGKRPMDIRFGRWVGIWKDTEAADRVVDQVFGDQVKGLWNNPDFVVEDMATLPDAPTDAKTA